MPATITESDVASYLRDAAAYAATQLPELRGIHVIVGNCAHAEPVSITGYVRGNDHLQIFAGATLAKAIEKARAAIDAGKN